MDRMLEVTARAEREHFWFRGFRAFMHPLLDLTAEGRGPLRILDCGCGTGHNMARLLRPYGRVVGIDLTWTGLSFARQTGAGAVVQATAARLPFGDAQFDLVTSFDVLQCVPDLFERDAVSEMARVLDPGGHLLVNVSALPWLRGDHSILTHEVRRYDRRRLQDLLRGAGLELRRVTYTNASLVPLLATSRFLQRRRGLVVSDEEEVAAREMSVPPAPINAVMAAILSAEARLTRIVNLPIGSSLVCLARRPSTWGPPTGGPQAG
jgi:SAM-dependent methyltransferase